MAFPELVRAERQDLLTNTTRFLQNSENTTPEKIIYTLTERTHQSKRDVNKTPRKAFLERVGQKKQPRLEATYGDKIFCWKPTSPLF